MTGVYRNSRGLVVDGLEDLPSKIPDTVDIADCTRLTVADVEEGLADIEAEESGVSSWDRVYHIEMERDLFKRVLRAIAAGHDNPRELALALEPRLVKWDPLLDG